MNQDLSREIYDLAGDISHAGPAFASIADQLLSILHSEQPADGLDRDVVRLAGRDSVVTLIGLVVEALAETKPVRDLAIADRHAARHHLAGIAHQLTALTESDHAETVAGLLNPA